MDRITPHIFLSLLFFVLPCLSPAADNPQWHMLEDGLQLGLFDPAQKSRIYASKIVILKIDPRQYRFVLMSASEHGQKTRTERQWCEEFRLIAAINASMYQSDRPLRSTGYMKNFGHLNNPGINPAFGAFFAFNRAVPMVPEVQIVDRRLQRDWKEVLAKYNTVVQNYRMISRGLKTGWPQSQEIYSTAAIGIDRDRQVLWILSRAPYSTHDFIHILLSLPIDVRDAIYLEGGPEASLYYHGTNGGQGRQMKDLVSKTIKNGIHDSPLRIPNVIGIVRKEPSDPS